MPATKIDKTAAFARIAQLAGAEVRDAEHSDGLVITGPAGETLADLYQIARSVGTTSYLKTMKGGDGTRVLFYLSKTI